MGYAEDVRVHRNALNDAERFVEDDVRRFPSDAGQLLDPIHVARDLSAEIRYDHACAFDAVGGLGMVEAYGADDVLDIGNLSLRESFWSGVALPERGRHLVHALVRRLSA